MPELSVVIAAQGSPELAQVCIESLLSQTCGQEQLELFLVEGPPYQACAHLSDLYPSVKFLHSGSDAIPRLHGLGVEKSTSDLVAITESHCRFPATWAENAINAGKNIGSASVLGGAVEPGSELDPLNTGLFLCDYAQFVPPLERAESSDLPGNNIVFRRECLDSRQNFAANGFWKTFYCQALEKHGKQLIAEPSMMVQYNRNLTFQQILARRWHHGRCFGGMRASTLPWSRRLLILLAAPLLPFLLLNKVRKRCARTPELNQMLNSSMGSITLCVFMWACGETFGNLFGAGDSCSRL